MFLSDGGYRNMLVMAVISAHVFSSSALAEPKTESLTGNPSRYSVAGVALNPAFQPTNMAKATVAKRGGSPNAPLESTTVSVVKCFHLHSPAIARSSIFQRHQSPWSRASLGSSQSMMACPASVEGPGVR